MQRLLGVLAAIVAILFTMCAILAPQETLASSRLGAVTLPPSSLERNTLPRALNVRDFGATGSGTVDDAPAIRRTVLAAVLAGGRTVYMPAGQYLLLTGVVQGGIYSN